MRCPCLSLGVVCGVTSGPRGRKDEASDDDDGGVGGTLPPRRLRATTR